MRVRLHSSELIPRRLSEIASQQARFELANVRDEVASIDVHLSTVMWTTTNHRRCTAQIIGKSGWSLVTTVRADSWTSAVIDAIWSLRQDLPLVQRQRSLARAS